jgi:hypothetical protein
MATLLKILLIFPPGWMQFGPYLSLPLLNGYLRKHGIEADLLDLNIEFYDWALSKRTLQSMEPRLSRRETASRWSLAPEEYARCARSLLGLEQLSERVERAKEVIRTPELYVDSLLREQAKRDLSDALCAVEASFDGLRLSLGQIVFDNCGLKPDLALPFLRSPSNIVSLFFRECVAARFEGAQYDLVGFSLPAWEQMVPALTIAGELRQLLPEAHFCMGGNYITRVVDSWRQTVHPFARLVDSFSLYEGENSLLHLTDALSRSAPLESVENLAYVKNEELVRTHRGGVDINDVPTPEFSGLPLHTYLAPHLILPLYTSRSCPFRCSFCTIPYASSEFRMREPDLVVQDIAALKEKHGTRLFTFVDETLTMPALRGVSAGIAECGLNIKWYGETRFQPGIDQELALLLRRSGCTKLQFGLESYNQRVLDLMQKDVRVEWIRPNIESCLSAGIAVHLFTFTGFPGETEEEARQTHAFAQEMLRISEERYANPFSSVGSGPFNLEVYSDVHVNPQKYGVTIVHPATTDGDAAMFEVDYTVSSGLSRQDAHRLNCEFSGDLVFRKACAKLDRVCWRSLSDKATNEDEDFILAALGGEKSRDAREVPSAPRPPLRPHRRLRRLAMAADVSRRWFERDFLKFEEQPRPCSVLAFYNSTLDRVFTVPGELGREIEAALSTETSIRLIPSARRAADLLIRNGFLDVDSADLAPAITTLRTRRTSSVTISLNPDVAVLRLDDRNFHFFNVVTEAVAETNTVVAWIASLLTERKYEYGRFVKHVVEKEPALQAPLVRSVVRELVRLGVVAAYAGH